MLQDERQLHKHEQVFSPHAVALMACRACPKNEEGEMEEGHEEDDRAHSLRTKSKVDVREAELRS